MASRFFRYVQDTRREMAHVSWPTRAQTVAFTIMVIAISLFVAVYLSVFDALFTQGLRSTLEHAPRFINATPSVQVETDVEASALQIETEDIPEFTVTPVVDESTNSNQ